jgi:hypothetical protein
VVLDEDNWQMVCDTHWNHTPKSDAMNISELEAMFGRAPTVSTEPDDRLEQLVVRYFPDLPVDEFLIRVAEFCAAAEQSLKLRAQCGCGCSNG